MSSRQRAGELSVRALLDSGRDVPRQPELVRARVLARARATARSAAPPAPELSLPSQSLTRFLAPAAGAVLALGVAGTVYALSGGWSTPPRAPSHARVPPANSVVPPGARAGMPAPAPATPPASTVSASANAPAAAGASPGHPPVARRTPASARQASYEAELELLRAAHTAYAANDYPSALVLTGEHARRFPSGALAEQREALRVRCLLRAGRVSQARQAAASFARRFPRSVLLRQLQAEVGTGGD